MIYNFILKRLYYAVKTPEPRTLASALEGMAPLTEKETAIPYCAEERIVFATTNRWNMWHVLPEKCHGKLFLGTIIWESLIVTSLRLANTEEGLMRGYRNRALGTM